MEQRRGITETPPVLSDAEHEMAYIGDVLDREEVTFTATGHKLWYHPDRLHDLRRGVARPIVAHLMPTDLCNFTCSFCSVANRSGAPRAKEAEAHVLGLEAHIKPAVDGLARHGLQAVVLSGGGEPTAYRDRRGNDFRDLMSYLVGERMLQVGLITNGSMLDRYAEETARCAWVRVSLYPFEYPPESRVRIPKDLGGKTTLGFSWVVAAPKGLTVDDVMRQDEAFTKALLTIGEGVKRMSREYEAAYVRLTPDCHQHGEKFVYLHRKCELIKQVLNDEDGKPFFHQHKFHKAPEACFLGYVHPVVYADGWVYPCDSLILNDPVDRRFKQEYAMCRVEEVDEFFTRPVRGEGLIGDTRGMCPRCVFYRNNTILMSVRKGFVDPDARVPREDDPHKRFV